VPFSSVVPFSERIATAIITRQRTSLHGSAESGFYRIHVSSKRKSPRGGIKANYISCVRVATRRTCVLERPLRAINGHLIVITKCRCSVQNLKMQQGLRPF
ncbi:hypothetical protein, partial [Pantoea agglomerans]|uniref:hypothetical protein n=1 Tax=Enterobacter agglomerans TaxID=549 RepID=UPI001EE7D551